MKTFSTYLIYKKDLGRQVKRKLYKDYIEYWGYKPKELNILGPDGKKIKDYTNMPLVSIVVCENDDRHIIRDNVRRILVAGVKFTEEHLTKYLEVTNRSAY
jgi:hypothetical protein